MTSVSPSRITSPNHRLRATDLRERTSYTGVTENRREILILKKEFLRAATSPPPPKCCFAVVDVVKRGLCRL
jgi:hypothetical protein